MGNRVGRIHLCGYYRVFVNRSGSGQFHGVVQYWPDSPTPIGVALATGPELSEDAARTALYTALHIAADDFRTLAAEVRNG